MARVLAVVPDLMLASRIEATLGAEGHEVELASSLQALEVSDPGPDVVVADLGEVDSSQLGRVEKPVLGFYSHVDVETRSRAERAGVDLVVPRSRLAREMPQLVESLVQS
jgi:DNA-binding response OmpR family regulator